MGREKQEAVARISQESREGGGEKEREWKDEERRKGIFGMRMVGVVRTCEEPIRSEHIP